jgi:hypothetical protein
MPTPPPVAHPAPSSLVMVPAPAVAVAERPPQDVGLVYTITSSTDSSKSTSPLGTTNTRLYLMAAASPGSLRVTAPEFAPVGSNLASSYARTGAASTTRTRENGTPSTVSRGAVSPSDRPSIKAMSDDTAGAMMAIAFVGPPVLISGGAVDATTADGSISGGAIASTTADDLTSNEAVISATGDVSTSGGRIAAPPKDVAPSVAGSPATPSTPAIIQQLSNAIDAIPICNLPGAEEAKSVGDWSRTLSIPASADDYDRDFSLDNDASKDNIAAKPRLAILARRFDT